MKSRETPEGLPVVVREVIDVFGRDVVKRHKEGTFKSFLDEIGERMRKDNPLLYKLVFERLYKRLEGTGADAGQIKQIIEYISRGAETTYELMRRQAEANKLEGE